MDSPNDSGSNESPISAFNVELQQDTTKSVNDAQEGDEVFILGQKTQERWVYYARLVSFVSIAFTLIGGVVGVVLSVFTDSVALLGYGLESFVDVWSSVLVLWRFSGDNRNDNDDDGDGVAINTKHTAFDKREQKASFGIAITFIVIGLFLGVKASIHLATNNEPSNADALLSISAISAVFLSVLAAVKFRISRELNSPALYKDGMSSAAVAVLSFGILISAAIYDASPRIWWLDNVVALLIAVFLTAYGLVSSIRQRPTNV